MKQQGFGGQRKPIQHRKTKTTKILVLKLECSVCKGKSFLPIKRAKSVEFIDTNQRKKGGKKTKVVAG